MIKTSANETCKYLHYYKQIGAVDDNNASFFLRVLTVQTAIKCLFSSRSHLHTFNACITTIYIFMWLAYCVQTAARHGRLLGSISAACRQIRRTIGQASIFTQPACQVPYRFAVSGQLLARFHMLIWQVILTFITNT